MFSVVGKVIVITGSSGLLGQDIVNTLRKEGAIVIGVDLHFYNQTEHDFIIDITDEESIKKAVTDIVNKYGRIDGWVNNAYPRTADWGNKLEDVSALSWKANVDMHLNGYFNCCQIVLNQMKQQGFGSLINMSSIYGIVGPDFSVYDGTEMTMPVAYSAIKGGLITLTKYLASYFGPSQVRVNSVSPGGVFNNQPASFVENYNKKVPLRRLGTSQDVVASIYFLLSDEANYITGHNLVVDGGWTAI
ncbi:oxidoreductase [Mucilaginibacter ximonensis]|uniref:Oxidoreductase n=1 Tax=Mucilaginibacter ximonensis TaxID=538021 RepID=A0ABW5YC05_9SPHI